MAFYKFGWFRPLPFLLYSLTQCPPTNLALWASPTSFCHASFLLVTWAHF